MEKKKPGVRKKKLSLKPASLREGILGPDRQARVRPEEDDP
jgi:hypothetical protein